MSRISLLIAALALFVCWPAQAEELKVGDTAPDFELQGSDGRTYKLSDFRGKQAVVIAWFPKAFTGGCTKQCQAMRQQGAAMRAYKVAYFTASVDPLEVNKKFAESLQLDYPILSDPDKTTAQAYGVVNATRQLPQRWTYYIGTNGKVLAIDKAVNTTSHGSDIAHKLAELGIAKR